ncbi:flagellar assembly protein FliW [Methylomagnum ishizawai]|uniref:flagellar assembly protein FliW n=1 Tax=Methylomagnum ishizawai TaxID=1760988 RepID=UPI001C34116B|nr:flagellar assembly protein FliW [Methylomagnum ishizawai]BBL76976.1 flagellar assembly factor FliW [Methylomagnum ishizawai]
MQALPTLAFGEQPIDPDTLLHFPEGIVGFEDCTHFKLFHQEGGDELVHWLQSADRPDLSLSVADPVRFGIHYDFALDDREAALIGLERPEDAQVLLILYKKADQPGIHGAIGAPLVVNVKNRKALQKVLDNIESGALLNALVHAQTH